MAMPRFSDADAACLTDLDGVCRRQGRGCNRQPANRNFAYIISYYDCDPRQRTRTPDGRVWIT